MTIKITDFAHINEKEICVYNNVHILFQLRTLNMVLYNPSQVNHSVSTYFKLIHLFILM
jgi:hypothetical protein